MEKVVEPISASASRAFWKGKRVLVTGHTGFKGGWLTLWLHALGAQVSGVGLAPNTQPSLFLLANIQSRCQSHICDIREAGALALLIKSIRPEIVLHLAAQPLVRISYQQPLETFAINVMGTAHVLDSLRGLDCVRCAVMVTTDKVYRNHETLRAYSELDALGGHDPYSASKAASEMVIESYRKSFLLEQGVAVASARAGNVIGGGDWSQDRLIPDAVRAWQSGQPLDIRRPDATRPWQHVIEPLWGYLSLAQQLWCDPRLADAYNFGPQSADSASVRSVIELAQKQFGKGEVRYGAAAEGPHEAGLLALDIDKARKTLGVQPRWNLEEALRRTMTWYRDQHAGADAATLCANQINEYEALV